MYWTACSLLTDGSSRWDLQHRGGPAECRRVLGSQWISTARQTSELSRRGKRCQRPVDSTCWSSSNVHHITPCHTDVQLIAAAIFPSYNVSTYDSCRVFAKELSATCKMRAQPGTFMQCHEPSPLNILLKLNDAIWYDSELTQREIVTLSSHRWSVFAPIRTSYTYSHTSAHDDALSRVSRYLRPYGRVVRYSIVCPVCPRIVESPILDCFYLLWMDRCTYTDVSSWHLTADIRLWCIVHTNTSNLRGFVHVF